MVCQLPDPYRAAPAQQHHQPTQVQKRPVELSRNGSDRHFEHDPSNRSIHPKETLSLRLALGSILAPKRPYTPSSRSSSGTASPAHPASVGSSNSHPPPHTTTLTEANKSDTYLHVPRAMHHPHTPSRLGMSAQDPADYHSHPHSPPGSSGSSAMVSPALSPVPSQGTPEHEHPPPLKLPDAVHDQEVMPRAQRPAVYGSHSDPVVHTNGTTSGSGSGTPRAKFLETLGSKRAWDALIHGSFS